MSDATSVYIYRDAAGSVLYVGVTSRGHQRTNEHGRDKDWWARVSSSEIMHCDTRAQALEIERNLIQLLKPPGNTQHNAGGEPGLDTTKYDNLVKALFNKSKRLKMMDKRAGKPRERPGTCDQFTNEQIYASATHDLGWLEYFYPRFSIARRRRLGCVACKKTYGEKDEVAALCPECKKGWDNFNLAAGDPVYEFNWDTGLVIHVAVPIV